MTHFLPRRLPRPRLHGRRTAGLSLLEMLLVIALIAAIGLITAAGLSRGFAGMQLRSAGKDIASQLRMVRAQAIARGEPQRFVIEPARRRWEGANQRHGEVPAQLQVQFEGAAQLATAAGQGVIEFHPDGGSSGGWLTGEVRSGPWRAQ